MSKIREIEVTAPDGMLMAVQVGTPVAFQRNGDTVAYEVAAIYNDTTVVGAQGGGKDRGRGADPPAQKQNVDGEERQIRHLRVQPPHRPRSLRTGGLSRCPSLPPHSQTSTTAPSSPSIARASRACHSATSMSRYNQKFWPRCKPCLKAAGSRDGHTWGNIEVVRRAGDGWILRCRRCGHTYRSSSRAAFRAAKVQGLYKSNQQPAEQPHEQP